MNDHETTKAVLAIYKDGEITYIDTTVADTLLITGGYWRAFA